MLKYFALIVLLAGCAVVKQKHPIIQPKKTEKKIAKLAIPFREKENGNLQVLASAETIKVFKSKGFVQYSDFGAMGDGKTDDMDAIAATHLFANKHGLTVKADNGAEYYISGKDRTAIIRTNTAFGNASFIIDDTNVENRKSSVFKVNPSEKPFKITTLTTLNKYQKKINIQLPAKSLITVTNARKKHYIRKGLNKNSGSPQTDIFVADKNGNVDMSAPIIWDFDHTTEVRVLPMDEKILKITGGIFTTIANKEPSKYNYYSRNFVIRRSNVVVDGMVHRIKGEGKTGAPYNGFMNISDCAYVTVQNSKFTGHKTYETQSKAGKMVAMGTYDISVSRALNISFISCSQINDINDDKYWGIQGSNYSKNLLYDKCRFSRFDAHKGVYNATIRNSTLGHKGINAIGSGTLTVENSTIRGKSFIYLRADYGSTWQGDVIIRNCTFVPSGGKFTSVNLISGSYAGNHFFGYQCHMPERIIIEKLHINDKNYPKNYKGPAIFNNINPRNKNAGYKSKFPYLITKEVLLKDISIASGKKLRLSDNPYMFRNVKIINK
jgi:hypothetical protein